jgi:hypothetical protein
MPTRHLTHLFASDVLWQLVTAADRDRYDALAGAKTAELVRTL